MVTGHFGSKTFWQQDMWLSLR